MKLKAYYIFLNLFIVTTIALIVALHFATAIAAEPDRPHAKRLPSQSVPPPPEMLKDEILVKYLGKNLPPTDSPERPRALQQLGDEFTRTFGIKILSTIVELGMHRIKIPAGESLTDMIARLNKHPAVDKVEPVYVAHLSRGPQLPPPDEPYWKSGDLWGMERIGMKELWDHGITGSDQVVAVIDTGIDYDHADWAHMDGSKNLWTDTTGKFGQNYCNNGNPSNDPIDDEGHGTAVAGVIGAVGNNGQDIAGVSWNVKIMAVKAFCKDNSNPNAPPTATNDHLAQGVRYAVDNGAWIINASWDIGTADSGILRDEIQNANQHNVLFVAASGNTLNDNDFWPTYPANYAHDLDNVVAVAATNERDQLWIGSGTKRYGSNWGKTTVHIAAPGDEIYSLTTSVNGGGITGNDGTSMAAAHVTGCAALMRDGRFRLSPKAIRDKINSSGDTVACLEGMVLNAKRLNCWRAVNPKVGWGPFGVFHDYFFGP